jgi:PAS domain S-box-containing protein
MPLPLPTVTEARTLNEGTTVRRAPLSRARRGLKRTYARTMTAIRRAVGQSLERTRAEDALRESEERFRTLAETASDAIITVDASGTIVFVNGATEQVFGHPVVDMIGRELTFLMPESLRHAHQAGFARYQKTDQRTMSWKAVELPGRHRDGYDIPLEISFGEFRSGGRRYFTGIVRDISERKRAEGALRRSREERLAELDHMRRRIAADLHDDIGSTLTQIAILSEVIRQRTEAIDFTLANQLAAIGSASRDLVDTLSDIVWAINPQRDHLCDLTQRMRRFAADTFAARNITCHIHLPGADDDVRVGASVRREMFLVFKEAINNIVRHSACSEARVRLTLADGRLVLECGDNGCGFDPDHAAHGHGLTSMRDRARVLGGRLGVESKPGRGATICLEVPLAPSVQDPSP